MVHISKINVAKFAVMSVCALLLFVATQVKAAVFDIDNGQANITSCGEMAFPGIYTLQNDIGNATTTCFIISSDGVTIDGAGHSVSGSGEWAVDARVYDNGSLVEGASAYTNLLINNITFNGFTHGVNISGNSDTSGNGLALGYGGDAGDVALYYATLPDVYANGGNSTTYSYGGLGGNITILNTESGGLDISDMTISATGGTGSAGRNTDGGLKVTYAPTAEFNKNNVTLSSLSYINVNDVDIAAPYVGGPWPILPGLVTSCGTLQGSGTYTLANDIGTSTPISGTCFTVVSDGVVFDGAGHSINSTLLNTDFAFDVGNSANFTLHDIVVNGFTNLIDSTGSVTLSGEDINIAGKYIEAGSLSTAYTNSFIFTGATVSALSNFILNDIEYGAYVGGGWPLTPGNISSCGSLLGTGTFTLASDLGTSTPISSTCFTMLSNGITFNGNGHTINGN